MEQNYIEHEGKLYESAAPKIEELRIREEVLVMESPDDELYDGPWTGTICHLCDEGIEAEHDDELNNPREEVGVWLPKDGPLATLGYDWWNIRVAHIRRKVASLENTFLGAPVGTRLLVDCEVAEWSDSKETQDGHVYAAHNPDSEDAMRFKIHRITPKP